MRGACTAPARCVARAGPLSCPCAARACSEAMDETCDEGIYNGKLTLEKVGYPQLADQVDPVDQCAMANLM